VVNSVFAEFAVGVLIDGDGVAEFTGGQADLRHTIFDAGVGPSGANTNAAGLFSDAARANTVEAALLGGISYTNNLGLNPRPQAGSPALGNVAPQGAGLTPTSYRGAFGTNDQWAHKWTAIYDLGYLAGIYTPSTQPPACSPASVTIVQSGTDVVISFSSVAGATYQVQSVAALPAAPNDWGNEGGTITGTGGVVTATIAITGDKKFIRVACLPAP
jgi:hypothetical protein